MQSREQFELQVVEGSLGLTLDDIHSLQTNEKGGGYEVSFKMAEKADETWTRVLQTPEVREKYMLARLGKPNLRTITVHMYDTFLPDDDIIDWLGQYGEVEPGVMKVVDPRGYWTGLRQLRVLLATDQEGYDGLCHPPALLNIGAVRGYLSYARQPPVCRRCRSSTHRTADCEGPRCHACNSADHLLRDCPVRRPSYADKARQAKQKKQRTGERRGGERDGAGPSGAASGGAGSSDPAPASQRESEPSTSAASEEEAVAEAIEVDPTFSANVIGR